MNDRLKKLISNADLVGIVRQDFELKDGMNYSNGVVHDSLVVDKRKNCVFWNSIGFHGNALDWLITIKGLNERDAIKFLEMYQNGGLQSEFDFPLDEPTIYPKLLDVFYELGKTHRDYWYNRGYTDETIDHFKLGYTGRCYVVPIILGGKLFNFQCRTPQKKIWAWSKQTGALPFNFDSLSEIKSVIVTESPVNSIALYQYGFASVSQTAGAGAWKKWWSGYFLGQDEITIIYDNDQAGLTGAVSLARKFQDRSRVLVWPEGTPPKYDPNDWLKDKVQKPAIMKLLIERTYNYEVVKTNRFRLWML